GTLKHPEAPGVRLRGESATHGWIIDAYGDYDRDSMVLWLWNERGAHRIEDPRFLPTFYLHAAPAELPEIRRRTELRGGVREVRERQLDPGGGALRPRVSAAAVEEGSPRPARRQSRGHPADAGQAPRRAHRRRRARRIRGIHPSGDRGPRYIEGSGHPDDGWRRLVRHAVPGPKGG